MLSLVTITFVPICNVANEPQGIPSFVSNNVPFLVANFPVCNQFIAGLALFHTNDLPYDGELYDVLAVVSFSQSLTHLCVVALPLIASKNVLLPPSRFPET